MKKAKKITMIGIIVVTALVIFMASFTNVVNASEKVKNEDSSAVGSENKSDKKERKSKKGYIENKSKLKNLTDEEKEALKAKREAKKAEKKTKFENMTDEEKEALKNKKTEKKNRKNSNAENSQNVQQ